LGAYKGGMYIENMVDDRARSVLVLTYVRMNLSFVNYTLMFN